MDYPTGIGYVPQEEGLLRGSPSLLLRSPSEDRSRQKLLYAPCFFWAVVDWLRSRPHTPLTEPPQSVQAPFGAMLHIIRCTVATAETVSHVASPLPCISVYQCVLRSAFSNPVLNNCYILTLQLAWVFQGWDSAKFLRL